MAGCFQEGVRSADVVVTSEGITPAVLLYSQLEAVREHPETQEFSLYVTVADSTLNPKPQTPNPKP